MVRKIGSILVALLVGGAFAARADTIEFIATLRGQIQTVTAKKVVSITETNFVAAGNHLLVNVNLDQGIIVFLEASGTVSNPVPFKTLLQTNLAAVMTNKNSFAVTLVPNGGSTIALQGGLAFGGELYGTGTVSFNKGVPKGLKATLTGIWNDPIRGDTNSPPALFKGTVVGKIPGAK